MADPFTRLSAALTELAACLCAGLDQLAADNPTTILRSCFCGVVVGQNVVNDAFSTCEDADGYAWVRLANSYPSSGPGAVSSEKHNYRPLALAADMEIGVQRTVLADDDGTISQVQHAEMVAQELSDMRAVYSAVACCSAFTDMEVIQGVWTPSGPGGMAYGGMLPLFVQVS